MVSFKVLLLATAGIAAAYPEPTAATDFDKRANCAKVTGALSVLKKLGPPATSFCSSYLKIPGTKTSTTTVTPVTTVTTSTSTITVTSAACPAPQFTGKKRRGSRLAQAEAAAAVDVEKRTDVLHLLAAFAAAKVSEGCSCLSISPKTTATSTIVAAPSTAKVVATTTTCTTLAQTCRSDGDVCLTGDNSVCCSGSCNSGTCGPPPCTRGKAGVVCRVDFECCNVCDHALLVCT